MEGKTKTFSRVAGFLNIAAALFLVVVVVFFFNCRSKEPRKYRKSHVLERCCLSVVQLKEPGVPGFDKRRYLLRVEL